MQYIIKINDKPKIIMQRKISKHSKEKGLNKTKHNFNNLDKTQNVIKKTDKPK